MNQNVKYGLFFLGGVALGALGAVAITRGKLDVKPLATSLLSSGLDLKRPKRLPLPKPKKPLLKQRLPHRQPRLPSLPLNFKKNI